MQRGIVNLPGQSGTIRNARNGEISRENGEIYRLPGRAGTRRQAVGFDQFRRLLAGTLPAPLKQPTSVRKAAARSS
jgi:hypothetical protein